MRSLLKTGVIAASLPLFAACSGGGGTTSLPAAPLSENVRVAATIAPSFGVPLPTGGPIRSATPTPFPIHTTSPQPTATPTARPSVAPTGTPSIAPTAQPTTFPTSAPTTAPTSVPTVAPTATPTSVPGAPREAFGLGCTHFRRNPMCARLPAAPSVSGSSALWASEQHQPGGRTNFVDFQITLTPSPNDAHDYSEPTYVLPAGSGIAHKLACGGFSWSAWSCGSSHLSGATVRVPAGAYPEGSSDHHLSIDDDANRREIDMWVAGMPNAVNGSVLTVGTAGQCSYDGDGTGCSQSTATQIATSLGAIDPTLVAAAESDPHGSLPYAISTTALCADHAFVYPAAASDGRNTDGYAACAGRTYPGGRPPEGSRYFLDLSDAQIDATPNAAYVKVVLRTLDREHYGGTITDTNWSGAPGLAFASMRGGWSAIAHAANVFGDHVTLPMTTNGIDLGSALKFCTNGTC